MNTQIIKQYAPFLTNNFKKQLNQNFHLNQLLSTLKSNVPPTPDFLNNLKYDIEKTKLDHGEYLNVSFISEKIRQAILKLLYKFDIRVSFNGMIIHLQYYHSSSNLDKKSKQLIQKIIEKTILVSLLIQRTEKTVFIKVYPTAFKKILPKQRVFEPDNINSGYSIVGREVVIFRSEELYKVLIHELLHYFDISIEEHTFKCGIYCDIFAIKKNTELILNEAYVEFWAIILNCIILIYDLQRTFDIAKIIHLLNYELDFSLYQCAKIFRHCSFTSYQDFLHNSHYKLEQKTHVFSYFIVKTALLFNINRFINKYNLHQQINRNEFTKLIIDSLKNPSFQKYIDKYIREMINKDYISNSLRMSLFG